MAAQVQLTEWQGKHLEGITFLLEQAEETIRSLKTEVEKAERGEEISPKTIWLKFRYIVFDLYSVLDYVYYFLYCHFSNGGQEAPIKDAVKLSFPYWAKEGVAISDSPERDQTEKFVTKYRKELCRTNPQKEKDAEAIIRYICELQPKRKVDDAGSQDLELPTVEAECLAMLHYYRNCVTHRDLIRFWPEDTWVRFNRDRGCYEFVNESQKGESTYLQKLDGQRFWIDIIKGNPFRLLMHVLNDLNRFGKTVTKLLRLGGIPFELPDATPEPAAPSRDPNRLNKKPTEKDLLYISEKIMDNWKSVCIKLDISKAKLSVCIGNNPNDLTQACYSALVSWLENSKSPPTWATLLEAMRRGGFRVLADEVATELQSGTELK